MKTNKTLSRIELSNRKAKSLQVWLEPWGEELSMPAEATWHFVSETNADNEAVSIEFHEDAIAICGIRDSIARMYQGSELLWECFQVVSPPQF